MSTVDGTYIQLAPGETSSSTTYKARIIGEFILEHLASHRATTTDSNASAPLMVAMHGPQGCGKTTLTDEIQRYLCLSKVKARSAVLSLDGKLRTSSQQNLYHTHKSLLNLRERHPQNALLSGRGLPGTHDLELARTTLDTIQKCNQGDTTRIELPIFDKSAFAGQGDRSTRTISIETPVDVFILEGWSMGFQALGRDELIRRYEQARSVYARQDSVLEKPAFLSHSLESLLQVDEYLDSAGAILYPPFSLLIRIRPESYSYVYAWRKQQEHQLIAARGSGMTDQQVEEFVMRYMPGYELWAGNTDGEVGSLWTGKSLVLWYDKGREVVSVDKA
ncbi:hypothetical protein QFC19_005158 [Naganishia cerealis]|uniref:Uncharacterized protein n=1 Tax=Naganishia cerealis TaxID=610337 RepID=A0ACC2VRJ3_9TREE|nr:hypothetical protein QFC19_005158 [Naganishia cerealis]